MADNNFKGTVEALFTGIDGVVSSKTVVGDAIHIGDTIILPLVDVSFAIGAGAFNADKKEKGAGGVGGKIKASLCGRGQAVEIVCHSEPVTDVTGVGIRSPRP